MFCNKFKQQMDSTHIHIYTYIYVYNTYLDVYLHIEKYALLLNKKINNINKNTYKYMYINEMY